MAVTDIEPAADQRMSMFIVPSDAKGIEIIRNVAVGYEREGAHAYMRYDNVRIPRDHMLGEPGQGFIVAQTRLGGGRIHHAMRTVAKVKRAFDMTCERSLSRTTRGSVQ